MNNLPTRKPNRLASYDYASPGFYFLTICTKEKACILGRVIPGDEIHAARMEYSPYGEIVRMAICEIPLHYAGVSVDHYVIMPNHIHMILELQSDVQPLPNISRIVQQLKRQVSMRIGESILQTHFHDHVIRGDADYREIWEYIENNPQKWALDRYYSEQ